MGFFDRLKARAKAVTEQAQGLGEQTVDSVKERVGGDPAPPAPQQTSAGSATTLVTGLFAAASDAEIALNNLDEAGFDKPSISVLAGDPHQAATLTDPAGTFSGLAAADFAAKLQALGLPAADSGLYRDQLTGGAVCIAIATTDATKAAAKEMLADQKAQHIHSLRLGGAA